MTPDARDSVISLDWHKKQVDLKKSLAPYLEYIQVLKFDELLTEIQDLLGKDFHQQNRESLVTKGRFILEEIGLRLKHESPLMGQILKKLQAELGERIASLEKNETPNV